MAAGRHECVDFEHQGLNQQDAGCRRRSLSQLPGPERDDRRELQTESNRQQQRDRLVWQRHHPDRRQQQNHGDRHLPPARPTDRKPAQQGRCYRQSNEPDERMGRLDVVQSQQPRSRQQRGGDPDARHGCPSWPASFWIVSSSGGLGGIHSGRSVMREINQRQK